MTVTPQPLKSNLRRVLQSLDALGQPIAVANRQRIFAAFETDNAAEIQQSIDPLVLATVLISPEERVSVRRGPAAANVQQAGFRPFRH